MLADVDAGSDTPSLVGKVLQWRKDNSVEGTACPLSGSGHYVDQSPPPFPSLPPVVLLIHFLNFGL